MIGPWKLTKAQARALDLICIFKLNKEAADYAGISYKTLEIQLQRTYSRMREHGVTFDGCTRTQAIILWQAYWRSEEGKANLRNVRLTQPTLA